MFLYFIPPKVPRTLASCSTSMNRSVLCVAPVPPTEMHRDSVLYPRWQRRSTGCQPLVQISLHCMQPFSRVNVSDGQLGSIYSHREWLASDDYMCPIVPLWDHLKLGEVLGLFVVCAPSMPHWWHVTLSAVRREGSKEGKSQADKILHFLEPFLLSFS